MTLHLQPKTTQDSLSKRATSVLYVAVALSLLAACFVAAAEIDDTAAQATQASASPAPGFGDVDVQQLERIFWVCDYAAATDGVDGSTGMACGNATEQLKQRKFDGDFAAMLAWWHDHKSAMYQALAQDQRQADERSGNATAQAEDLPMP